MKKIFILIAISLISVYSYAQLTKGSWITSVNGNGSYNTYAGHRDFKLRIQPSVMKLVGHNLALGLNTSTTFYSNNSQIIRPDGISRQHSAYSLEAGPVLRKYFGDYKLKPYAELSSGFCYEHYVTKLMDGGTYKSDMGMFYIKPAIGLSYWFTDKVALDMKVSNDFYNGKYSYIAGEWNFNVGVSVKLGK